MALAIINFAGLEADKKMVVLGDMLELGKESLNEHKKILELIIEKDLQNVILVGNEFSRAGAEKRFLHFSNVNNARIYLSKEKIKGQLVLIKGSRGMQLEKLTEVF
jgi:UDP-N-acetylmuramoyl-tripeptide--D-alanyl-D-alanine ligase